MATASLIAEAQSVSQSKDTTQFTETYAVTGLVNPDDRVKLFEALSATGLPALGAAHPALAAALCVGRNVGVFGVSTATVECSFEVPTSDSDNPLLDTTGVARFNASTISDRTSFDKDGILMQNPWSGTLGDIYPGINPSSATQLKTWDHIVEIDINRPQWSFELSLRVTDIIALAQLSVDYVGRINSLEWGVLAPGTFPNLAARTALCLAIDLEVVNSGEGRAVFQFGYQPETYDYVDTIRVDNRIPLNVEDTTPNGIKNFDVYPTADFNLLPVRLA